MSCTHIGTVAVNHKITTPAKMVYCWWLGWCFWLNLQEKNIMHSLNLKIYQTIQLTKIERNIFILVKTSIRSFQCMSSEDLYGIIKIKCYGGCCNVHTYINYVWTHRTLRFTKRWPFLIEVWKEFFSTVGSGKLCLDIFEVFSRRLPFYHQMSRRLNCLFWR